MFIIYLFSIIAQQRWMNPKKVYVQYATSRTWQLVALNIIARQYIVHGTVQYPFTVCSKTFSQADHLRRHIPGAHEEERSEFKCDECGKVFNEKSNLKQHKTYILEHNILVHCVISHFHGLVVSRDTSEKYMKEWEASSSVNSV